MAKGSIRKGMRWWAGPVKRGKGQKASHETAPHNEHVDPPHARKSQQKVGRGMGVNRGNGRGHNGEIGGIRRAPRGWRNDGKAPGMRWRECGPTVQHMQAGRPGVTVDQDANNYTKAISNVKTEA